MTNFQIFPPLPPLRSYIQYYVMGNISDSADLPFTQEILPLNLTAITFFNASGIHHFFNSENISISSPDVMLVGPMRNRRKTQFIRTGLMISVVFTVVGLHKFYGLQMDSIVDKGGNGAEIIEAGRLSECREAIFNAIHSDQAIHILDAYFLRLLNSQKTDLRNIDRIAQYINDMKGNINMDWLVDQANMSVKTFERHFNEKIGLPPKFYSRIVRFSHSMKMLEQKKEIFDIIDGLGYTDQSHFIKEFSYFAGNTPRHYYYEFADSTTRMFLDNSIEY